MATKTVWDEASQTYKQEAVSRPVVLPGLQPFVNPRAGYEREQAQRVMRGQGIGPGGMPAPISPLPSKKSALWGAAFLNAGGDMPLEWMTDDEYNRSVEAQTLAGEFAKQNLPFQRPKTFAEQKALNAGATPANVNKPFTFTFDWAQASPFYKKPADEIYRMPASQVQEKPDTQSYGDPYAKQAQPPGDVEMKELPKPGETTTPTQKLNAYWSGYMPTSTRRRQRVFDYQFGSV